MDDDLVPGSPVRRWRLGKQLRELREAAGKSQDEAADYLGVKRPTISRIENGRHAILPKNVKFLCQLYNIGAPEVDTLIRQAEESNERGWWVTYSDTMPDWFETYVGYEADARVILSYQSEFIPGLLQDPEYVRALKTSGDGDGDIEKSVEFRLARQRRLDTKPPEALRVVLNEAVLHRLAGGPDARRAQIAHLLEMCERDFVSLRILPFSAGPHPAMKGPFSLLTLPDEPRPNFVYLEHDHGAVYLERPSDIERYDLVFRTIEDMSLSASETRDRLRLAL